MMIEAGALMLQIIQCEYIYIYTQQAYACASHTHTKHICSYFKLRNEILSDLKNSAKTAFRNITRMFLCIVLSLLFTQC